MSFIAVVWRVSAEGQKTRDDFSTKIALIVASQESDKTLKAAKDAEQDRRLDAHDDDLKDLRTTYRPRTASTVK